MRIGKILVAANWRRGQRGGGGRGAVKLSCDSMLLADECNRPSLMCIGKILIAANWGRVQRGREGR